MKHLPRDAASDRRVRAPRALRIVAPGRLHIGFLDLNGSLGRRFGSLGVAVEQPSCRVLLETAEQASAKGPDAERALEALRKVCAANDRLDERVRIVVERALPAHAGLGSGTQLALAVGVGASVLGGHAMAPAAVARTIGRGARSSIGLGAFEGGGVLLDGGQPVSPDPNDHRPPPLLSRIAIPETWRILLMFDGSRTGLSGSAESDAMKGLPEFPERLAERLCRLTLMGAMPAAANGDADAFGRAVGEIQRRLGDHFARFQGGRFTSPDVAEALKVVEAEGVPGVGQSSWGPTGFAIFGDAVAAEDAAADLAARFADRPHVSFDVVRGDNRGATIADAPHSTDGPG
jgi:beta-ribofuranosylaminobenzene 5'-phosphate synthase